MVSRHFPRRPHALAAVVLAVALSGCSATNQITTQVQYDASDGIGATLGQVSAQNLLLVAAGADQPGAVQGALSNRGERAEVVTLSVGESDAEVEVGPGATVLLGGENGEQVLLAAPDAPGATTDLTISTAAGGSQSLRVPVLDGTLPEYTGLVPDADALDRAGTDG